MTDYERILIDEMADVEACPKHKSGDARLVSAIGLFRSCDDCALLVLALPIATERERCAKIAEPADDSLAAVIRLGVRES